MIENKNLCLDCNQPNIVPYWCNNCNSKQFRQNFNKWTSGNSLIDNFIQDAQLKARNYHEVLEWIPYDRFRNIEILDKGGFSTIYKAIWLDGSISKWDKDKNQWHRYFYKLEDKNYQIAKQVGVASPLNENEKTGRRVALKSLNNSSNIEDVLSEVTKLLHIIVNCL